MKRLGKIKDFIVLRKVKGLIIVQPELCMDGFDNASRVQVGCQADRGLGKRVKL